MGAIAHIFCFNLLVACFLLSAFRVSEARRENGFSSTGRFLSAVKAVNQRKIHKRKTSVHSTSQPFDNTISTSANPDSVSKTTAPYIPKNVRLHGGEVLSTGVHVYIIWYGTWTTAQKNYFRNFINSLGASPSKATNTVRSWYTTVTLYYDTRGRYVSPSISIVKEVDDNYSKTKHLRDNSQYDDVYDLVSEKLSSKSLPSDPKGIYLVLTSKDVVIPTYCTYCGYHTFVNLNNDNNNYVYALIPNPNSVKGCLAGCGGYYALSGDIALDGMIDSLAHEIAEAVTDPDTAAGWLSDKAPSEQNEIADICDNYYGKSTKISNGNYYNLAGLSSAKYYVQSIFNGKIGSCVISS